jgi:hypothetical protein
MCRLQKELRMKILGFAIALGLATGWTTLVGAVSTADSPEKQMQKCAVCKALAARPELMKNMNWETHKIENGMLSVASVSKDQKKEFDAVHEEMLQNIEQVKAAQRQGKDVELCDYCKSMSELMKSGAKKQDIDTATGGICLVTSSDPAVVEKIHAVADMAIAEQKTMAKAQHDNASR